MKVELHSIHKHFGKVHANDDITLNIPAGTIQGILGENGAGKSTLMKVLSGFIQADSGDILLDGKPIIIHSPADAIKHGIGMLHQDPLDFPPMRIVDNFILGAEGGLFPNRAVVVRDFKLLAEQYGFSIDPDSYVDALTVGERQQLEILRLLWLGARVLILDEPTTGISSSQKVKLFATLRKLAAEGKTMIFVSHKLEDVEALCHQAVVLRQGKLIGEMQKPFDPKKLVAMMFGKEISLGARQVAKPGEAILSLQHVSLEDVRLKIKDVSLEVHAGEVIGLAGMEGSGQGPFLRACAGLMRPVGGHVLLKGQDLTGKPYHAYKHHGVEFLPASRLEEGLVPGLTLTEHFILAEEPKGMFIDREYGRKLAEERIKSFNIKGTPVSTVESLSGGNQQRALLSLLNDPLSLVLIEHPTRGLDIESVIYIWSKLKDRCRQGAAILFISSDLEEVLQYSDRVLVFFSGKVSEPLDAAQTSVEQLGQLIGGRGWPEKQAV
ncbi:MAG: ATP-binding cassette domain-containing protein [Chloroflexi bacterium]|nr:ATP-binding cassette domain-containing protein [Chloroflexota bacterium]